MIALIEIDQETTKIDVYNRREEVEMEMKKRYNKKILMAKNINWGNTFLDNDLGLAKVDVWDKVTELRVGEIVFN